MKTKKHYRYRIYTEHVNFHGIRDILDKYFDGYTTYTGMGVWQGETERNLTIEIITLESRAVDIEAACRKINRANKQACCFVTVDRVLAVFI